MLRIMLILVSAVFTLPAFAQSSQDSSKAVEMSLDEIRVLVDRVGKGRSLEPASWPGGARVAVLLSSDADDETVELRFGGQSSNNFSD